MTSSQPQQDLFQLSDNITEPNKSQNDGPTLFLTPNNRLAREFSKPTKQSNAFVSHNTPAYSLSNYESLLWDQLLRAGHFLPACKRIINTSQIEYIWQDIISACEPDILNINQTAKLCAKAFDLESQYCVPEKLDDYQDEEKYRIYLKFKALFVQKLDSLNAICASQKTPLILDAFKTQHLPLPFKVITYDLEQIPQIWQNIFDYFKAHHVIFEKTPLKKCAATDKKIIACEDLDHEINAMLNDAYNFMNQHPDKHVALIVHDLANLKNKIEHGIKRIFEPSLLTQLTDVDLSIDDFNITASNMLSQAPIIQAALNALSLNVVNIDFNSLSQFLLSPFFTADESINNDLKKEDTQSTTEQNHLQAMCEAKLRDENIQQLTKKQWIFFLNRFPDLQSLKTRMEAFFSFEIYESKTPSQWSQHFTNQLSSLNWPGARILTSLEHQQVKHWPNCLNELSMFDDLLDKITIGQALSLLNQIISNTSFHAQTPHSRLQVLGTLEAKGLTFDKAWILQMDQTAWPSFATAHPFLPQALQQKYNLPHCSMERELHYTQEITEALAGIAKDVTFSVSTTKDGQPILPSQLLPDWEIIDIQKQNSALDQHILNRPKETEIKTWNQTSAFITNEITPLPGSTYYIKTFNQCPFKAFMQYRCKVDALSSATTGILAFERGNIIHNCLEKFYRITNNQTKLKNMDDTELLENINPKLIECLEEFNRKKIAPLSQTIIDLEYEYLQSLILLFLQAEQQRGDFSIHALEARRTLEIGNIQLKMSIDRIDQLQDGSLYYWDYKSGKTEIKQWFSDPLKDPQLPIYTLSETHPEKIAGIGFAKINPADLQNNKTYQGIQKDNLIEIASGLNSIEELYEDKKAKWMEQQTFADSLVFWKDNIEQSITKISDGHHPSQPCDLCTYCDYKSLCKEYLNDQTNEQGDNNE